MLKVKGIFVNHLLKKTELNKRSYRQGRLGGGELEVSERSLPE